MLAAALGDLTGKVDSAFLTAFLAPAAVAVLGVSAMVVVHAGVEPALAWMHAFTAMEQGIVLLIVAIGTMVIAFMLRALSATVLEFFAGVVLPSWMTARMRSGQIAARQRSRRQVESAIAAGSRDLATQQRLLAHTARFPLDEARTGPTRLANVMSAIDDHPRRTFNMNGYFWLSRLLPLLPDTYQASLKDGIAPVMGFLNLGLILAGLGMGWGAFLAFSDGQIALAAAAISGGLLLARGCYLAAVNQTMHVAEQISVAFDLYHNVILTHLGIPVPATREEELALWAKLEERFADESRIGPFGLLRATGDVNPGPVPPQP